MKTQIEYIVIVNGRPFFSVTNPCNLQMVVNEARSRFGKDIPFEILKQVTESYEPSAATDDSE